MQEKTAEKHPLQPGNSVPKPFSRFDIQVILMEAGNKGIDIKGIQAELKKGGVIVSHMTIRRTITEMVHKLPPKMHVGTVTRRVGPTRVPANCYYIIRYKKK